MVRRFAGVRPGNRVSLRIKLKNLSLSDNPRGGKRRGAPGFGASEHEWRKVGAILLLLMFLKPKLQEPSLPLSLSRALTRALVFRPLSLARDSR